MARAADECGMDVVVATRADQHVDVIRAHGYRHIPLRHFRRGTFNPVRELLSVWELARIYRAERPDIVLHVSLKIILLGGIAAGIAGVRRIVNLVPGLGSLLIGDSFVGRFAHRPMLRLMRYLIGRGEQILVVQNRDNEDFFIQRNIVDPERLFRIDGSGVDTVVHSVQPPAEGPLIAALVGRMLWSKGVGEAVAAAEILKRRGSEVRIALVGIPDHANWNYVPRRYLRRWQNDGLIEWWGYQDDIVDVWRRAEIAILPTYYGEGIPKALLEAGACGRAVVTTDVSGCRDLISDQETGLLIAPRSPEALADAIEDLASSRDRRQLLGQNLRTRIVGRYDDQAIVQQTKKILGSLCGH